MYERRERELEGWMTSETSGESNLDEMVQSDLSRLRQCLSRFFLHDSAVRVTYLSAAG